MAPSEGSDEAWFQGEFERVEPEGDEARDVPYDAMLRDGGHGV